MTTPFLTIAEAAASTGRSQSTIRRLIHTIAEHPHHPDRDAIQPSVKEVKVLKEKDEIFTWRIREDVLKRNLDSAPKKEKKLRSDSSDDVLSILRRELDLKNHQIEKQLEVIQSLNERLREGNILMGSLQERLALPEAPSTPPPLVEVSVKKSSTESSKEASTKAIKKGKKKGFLHWLRG